MSEPEPTVVLVHGAFAESASWSGVIERLQARAVDVIAVANPLRSVPGDAAYQRDVIAGINAPVVLVGHSYGGMVITEAASDNDKVAGLIYVCAFAPEQGESAFDLSNKFPGSTASVPTTGRCTPPCRMPHSGTSVSWELIRTALAVVGVTLS